jgi:hypothetical protein
MDMKHDKTQTYSASFRNQELRIWESNGCWPWSVTNSDTGEVIAQGEAVDRASAMVSAAQAAQADWGSVRWRRFEEDDENEEGIECV